MKYLDDNGFKVIKMSDIEYKAEHYLYIKEPITNDNTLAKNC